MLLILFLLIETVSHIHFYTNLFGLSLEQNLTLIGKLFNRNWKFKEVLIALKVIYPTYKDKPIS